MLAFVPGLFRFDLRLSLVIIGSTYVTYGETRSSERWNDWANPRAEDGKNNGGSSGG